MLETPLVFIVFNRPETTRRVWERIRAVRPKRLFVIADGPRANRPADAGLCAAVRRIVAEPDWPCEVTRDYSSPNLGAAARVSSGLDRVFAQVEEAIILEDDCLPDATFFPFCTELLARYRNEPRVAQIAGCSFQGPDAGGRTSYYFSRYPHGWGWATWRRAWRHYDHTMRAWREERGGTWLDRTIRDPAERRIWAGSFDATLAGEVDAWDYRWVLAVWRAEGISITPYRNLISNIGFAADATHTRGSSPWDSLPLSPMPFPLVHPADFTPDETADERTGRQVFRPPSWPARAVRRARRLFSR
ncbi:MAG TPA: hypothetical protein VHN79_03810 [Lacunisphaera sp.]|nr:hypothetical protein [Lacunisphaera sp.]